MSTVTPCPYFMPFNDDISHLKLPTKFTYPFCYQPDPLAKIAALHLQDKLQKISAPNNQGRMYGVLVVKNAQQQLGFIAAVSGTQLDLEANTTSEDFLVPPVFSGFDKGDEFFSKQADVNHLNDEIKRLLHTPEYLYQVQLVASENAAAKLQISRQQTLMVNNKQARKHQRALLVTQLTEHIQQTQPDVFAQATTNSIELARQSVADKKQLAQLKQYWQHRIDHAEYLLTQLEQQISTLKTTRRKLSKRLQKYLFKQYQLLNSQGEVKNLLDIFTEYGQVTPPAGAGDCAAPKLLQHAFRHELTPICLAEFWWGQPAISEIRKHQHFYPACQGKCQPILNHMLKGMPVDNNPLLINPGAHKSLEIIYQDQDLVVVNKPAGLLSVPGKNIEDSVYTRIKAMFPDASGSLILHRLDMATSGLLLLSLNQRAHKHLQQQFINKAISKRYVALLDGKPSAQSGIITLPLITDIDDRPRQKVCFKHGKTAETRWQILEQNEQFTRVQLNPVTGRTHQLRVHCAHPQGLNIAIVGDGLYGTQASRLHLHAERLSFTHPISKQPMVFHAAAEF